MDSYAVALEMQIRSAEHIRRRGGMEAMFGQVHAEGSASEPVVFGINRAIEIAVERGDTFYVNREIYNLVTTTSDSMPDNWIMQMDRVPTPHGFVLMDAPGGYEAMTYIATEGVTLITSWGRERDHMRPMTSLSWFHGRSIAVATATEPDALASLSWVAAFCEFIKDRILTTRTQSAPRSTRRKLERIATLPHDPVVRVVELRARQYETIERDGDPQHRDYSCQWFVRGHWRQQWYPSLGRHQPKWITPYVKGPEDKPLKTPRANVFAVVR